MGEAVVNTKYLLGYPAEFTLTKESSWSDLDWSISDGDGNVVFRTESRYRERYSRTRLLDVTANQVVCFQTKHRNRYGTWNIYSGPSELVLFTLKTARWNQTRTAMNVFLPLNLDKENPDYKIRLPRAFSSTFSILHGSEEVAVVQEVRKWFGTSFKVKVSPGTDSVFIFTLIIISYFDD